MEKIQHIFARLGFGKTLLCDQSYVLFYLLASFPSYMIRTEWRWYSSDGCVTTRNGGELMQGLCSAIFVYPMLDW